jgi:hypothetical protein
MADTDGEGWRAAGGETVLGEVEFHVDCLNVEISRV